MFGVDGCAKPQFEILLLSTEACTGAGPALNIASVHLFSPRDSFCNACFRIWTERSVAPLDDG